jgi:glycine/D-amino acid oxidase-like deaminating enzyme
MVAYSKIVIAGGGIVGNSISYYLARRYSVPCTIIDPVGIAPAASGKAGGFLARDWSDHSPVGELQRRSFDLHAEQAKELGEDKLNYRRLEAAAVMLQEGGMASKPSGKKLEGLEWADVNVRGANILGGTDTIAQVCTRLISDVHLFYESSHFHFC